MGQAEWSSLLVDGDVDQLERPSDPTPSADGDVSTQLDNATATTEHEPDTKLFGPNPTETSTVRKMPDDPKLADWSQRFRKLGLTTLACLVLLSLFLAFQSRSSDVAAILEGALEDRRAVEVTRPSQELESNENRSGSDGISATADYDPSDADSEGSSESLDRSSTSASSTTMASTTTSQSSTTVSTSRLTSTASAAANGKPSTSVGQTTPSTTSTTPATTTVSSTATTRQTLTTRRTTSTRATSTARQTTIRQTTIRQTTIRQTTTRLATTTTRPTTTRPITTRLVTTTTRPTTTAAPLPLPGPEKLVNGGFEQPSIANGAWEAASPIGWSSQSGYLEIWGTGHDDVDAREGTQLAELNTDFGDTYSQQFSVIPKATYTWSLYHRGRLDDDTLEVLVDGKVVARETSGSVWRWYSGTVVVPQGQQTMEFGLRAVDSGSRGNLIDRVMFRRTANP